MVSELVDLLPFPEQMQPASSNLMEALPTHFPTTACLAIQSDNLVVLPLVPKTWDRRISPPGSGGRLLVDWALWWTALGREGKAQKSPSTKVYEDGERLRRTSEFYFFFLFESFLHLLTFSFSFSFFYQSCNALSLASLCCGRCFSSSWIFLGLFSFFIPSHCSIYSTVVSFLSFSFFVVCLVGGRWMVDVGGQLSLDEVFLLSLCVGRRSASPLVDFIQDGSGSDSAGHAFGEKRHGSLSHQRYTPCITFSFSLPIPTRLVHFPTNPTHTPMSLRNIFFDASPLRHLIYSANFPSRYNLYGNV